MSEVQRQEGAPFDSLTGLANEMLNVIDNDADIKAIVMLTDDQHNGIGLAGWEDDTEAIAYMFLHLQAMFRGSGKELRIMTGDGIFIDNNDG